MTAPPSVAFPSLRRTRVLALIAEADWGDAARRRIVSTATRLVEGIRRLAADAGALQTEIFGDERRAARGFDLVRRIAARVHVGNIYVNRTMIGAHVGCQPFGGERLSGTGPKAGDPGICRDLPPSG